MTAHIARYEQQRMGPGHWVIIGWTVRKRTGSRAKFWGTGEWSATWRGHVFTRRTLDEVREAIARHRDTGKLPEEREQDDSPEN